MFEKFICSSCKEESLRKPKDGPTERGRWYVDDNGNTVRGKICGLCFKQRVKLANKKRLKYMVEHRKKFIKTLRGTIKNAYWLIKSRTTNKNLWYAKYYNGLEILDSKSFYDWSIKSPTLKNLFKKYKDSGFILKLKPTIDRIDPSLGYTLDNIQWLTFSQNCSKKKHSSTSD